jgi:small subunit ribosomal protein S9
MATKKTAKKEEEVEVEKTEEKSQYFYAVGKRKTAIAQVRIYLSEKAEKGIVVNEKKFEEYFPIARLRDTLKAPLAMAGQDVKFDVSVKVRGGGVSAQAEAVRLGISRALVKFNGDLKKSLRDRGFMTRDARKVERKKPGLKKARKSPQWAKR